MRTADRGEPDRASPLLRLSFDVTGTLDLQEVLDRSLDALRRLADFGGGSIQLVEAGVLRLAATDPPATADALAMRVPVGRGVGGLVVSRGDACYIPDVTADERVYPPGLAKATSPGVRSWFGVPLVVRGEAIGLVQVDDPRVDAFDEATRDLVTAFVPAIASGVQNARLFEREAEALARLREAERLKNEFLGLVSHELRTPVTSIYGFADILAARAASLDTAIVGEFGRRIAQSARRLEAVVEDILDITGIEQGVFFMEVGPIDVLTVVRAALDASPDAPRVRVRAPADLPLANADPDRLRQVLLQLIGNAAKFSPAHSPIDLSVALDADRVVLAVEDRGRGIAPESLERIFERFWREGVAEPGPGGLGIGLYLVKKLTERMNAEVRVQSRAGEGSRFEIRLLRARERTPARDAASRVARADRGP